MVRITKHRLAEIHDLIAVLASFLAAIALRLGDQAVAPPVLEGLWLSLVVLALCAVMMFRVFGLHKGIWAYASLRDLLQITKATTAIVFAFLVITFLVNRLDDVPRSVPVIQWFVLLFMLGGPRFAYRLYRDHRAQMAARQRMCEREPILVIGSGDRTDLLIRSLAANQDASYRVVAVLDDKGGRVGRNIHGVPVAGHLDAFAAIIDRLAARGDTPVRAVLTVDRPPGELRRLFALAERKGVMLSTAPDITRFPDPRVPINLEPLSVEKLLGRSQTSLDRSAIGALVKGRRVLITGAGGTIGSELAKQIARLAPESLTLVDHAEYNLYMIDRAVRSLGAPGEYQAHLLDVRDPGPVNRVVARVKPQIIFHAAALKHVPIAEMNPISAVTTNVIGTCNVADAALAAGVEAMVLISTDKAVRPKSVMGATKRVAEAYCQALDASAGTAANGGPETRFLTVRFGNVLGSSGSVVPLFREQLAQGGPLTVTHPEMRRYFMTVHEAVELVLRATWVGLGRPEDRGGIFILDMGEPVRILDLARQMIRLAGLEPEKDIDIRFTGLRPGEKLSEELLDEGEVRHPTAADGVLTATPRVIERALLERAIRQLQAAAGQGALDRITKILGNIVPGYAPVTDAAPGVDRPSPPTREARR